MAQAKIKDFLKCPLCFEELTSPKTLPCLHSFCEKCIHDFIISLRKTKNDKLSDSYSCPVCRTLVKPKVDSQPEQWALQLPGNITAELLLLQKRGTKLECKICKRLGRSSEANSLCVQCEDIMCEKCREIHCEIKTLSGHKVLSLKDAIQDTDGIDFFAVRVNPCHTPVDKYCSDHREICCKLCSELKHKSCRTKPVDFNASISVDDKLYDSLPGHLLEVKEAISTLINEREIIKKMFRANVTEVDNEAKEFVEAIKNKLDDSYDRFKKELDVMYEENNTKMNVRLRYLEQFARGLEHWSWVASKMKGHTTESQAFVLVETMKDNVNANIKEIKSNFQTETEHELKFEKTNLLSEERIFERIGSLVVSREEKVIPLELLFKTICLLGINLSVDKTHVVEYRRSIEVPKADIIFGVSIDSNSCILISTGDKKLHLLQIPTGLITDSPKFPSLPRKCCFDDENKLIFVSCDNCELYVAKIDDNTKRISKPVKLDLTDDFVGDVCLVDDKVFVIVDRAIKSFPKNLDHRNKLKKMINCIETNTECGTTELHAFEGKLVYTTLDGEIKCTSLNGEEIFCYKNPNFKSAVSIAALPHGSILLLDFGGNGKLHILSSDGKQLRTLLDEFLSVTKPCDIWLGVDGKTFYVCGGQFIDVYSLE